MVAIKFITASGAEQDITAQAGLSLMENAVAGGVAGILALCGGNAYCGTCRVYIDPAWQPVTGLITQIEQPMIAATEDDNPAVRLSCQIPVTAALDGLIVRLPEKQA